MQTTVSWIFVVSIVFVIALIVKSLYHNFFSGVDLTYDESMVKDDDTNIKKEAKKIEKIETISKNIASENKIQKNTSATQSKRNKNTKNFSKNNKKNVSYNSNKRIKNTNNNQRKQQISYSKTLKSKNKSTKVRGYNSYEEYTKHNKISR